MRGMNELTHLIKQWAQDRDITTGGGTAIGQANKSREEVTELEFAVADGDPDELKDAIGDIYVTLVIQAEIWGLDMRECIEHAWEQIKDRTGRMENGVFVKDEDDGYMD